MDKSKGLNIILGSLLLLSIGANILQIYPNSKNLEFDVGDLVETTEEYENSLGDHYKGEVIRTVETNYGTLVTISVTCERKQLNEYWLKHTIA